MRAVAAEQVEQVDALAAAYLGDLDEGFPEWAAAGLPVVRYDVPS